jgi:MFS family permease
MTAGPPQKPQTVEAGARRSWRVGSLTYTAGGLATLFFWLLWGDFAWTMRDRAVPPVLQLLLNRFGASDMLTGLIMSSLPAALGLIIGPVVSYKSDRLRSRWGRRIPFLVVPIPFLVLSMIGLAFCPQLGGTLSRLLGTYSPGPNWSVIIVMGVFWTLFDIACGISASVFGALINDVVPQTVIGRFYGLFRAAGLVAGILFFYNVKDHAESGSTWILLGVAALYGGGFTLMCLNVKEGEYPPLSPASDGPGVVAAIKAYFKDGLGNPYYLWFFASMILGTLATQPFNLYSVYYAKSIGMEMDAYFKCLALTYVFSLALAYPLGSLADRFHPLRVTIGSLALYAIIMVVDGLLVRNAFTFSVALIAHGIVAGCVATAMASLSQRILPRDKFAEIGSVGGIISAVCTMFFAPLIGMGLDHVNHDYHYTFYAGSAVTVAALGVFGVLYAKFMALGGPTGYIAPGTEWKA